MSAGPQPVSYCYSLNLTHIHSVSSIPPENLTQVRCSLHSTFTADLLKIIPWHVTQWGQPQSLKACVPSLAAALLTTPCPCGSHHPALPLLRHVGCSAGGEGCSPAWSTRAHLPPGHPGWPRRSGTLIATG